MIVKNNDKLFAMFDVALDPDHAFATPEVNEMLSELHRVKKQIKLLEECESILSSRIKEFMGNKESLIDKDGTIGATYKSYDGPERLHMDTLKCIFPDVYKECLVKTDNFRRFLLK